MAQLNQLDVNLNNTTASSFTDPLAAASVRLRFDEAVTEIELNKFMMVPSMTSTDETYSLAGSTVSGLGSTELIITLGEEILTRLRSQGTSPTVWNGVTSTTMYVTSESATVPAYDTTIQYQGINEYQGDNYQGVFVEGFWVDEADIDADGNATRFTVQFDKPMFDLNGTGTNFSIYDGTTTTAISDAGTRAGFVTSDQRYVTVTLAGADITGAGAALKAANAGLLADPGSSSDWAGNPFVAVTTTNYTAITKVAGTVAIASVDSIDLGAKTVSLTMTRAVNYVDATLFNWAVYGVNPVSFVGSTAAIDATDKTKVVISLSAEAFSEIIEQHLAYGAQGGGLDASGGIVIDISSTAATAPISYQQALHPAPLPASVENDFVAPVLSEFNYYTSDSTAEYNAIISFNDNVTLQDSTKFVFQDNATSPMVTRTLMGATSLTRLDGYTYGVNLSAADATAINAFAGNNSVFLRLDANAVRDAGFQSNILMSTAIVATVFTPSVSPTEAYRFGDIALVSENVTGEVKLPSGYRYDAVTLNASPSVTTGGQLEFGAAPVQGDANGKVLTIQTSDYTSTNPVLSLGWEEAGVTRVVAGDNVTLSAETGTVVINAAGSEGGGANHFAVDVTVAMGGDVNNPTQAELTTAAGATLTRGDFLYNTNAASTNDQRYYQYVATGATTNSWRRLAVSIPA